MNKFDTRYDIRMANLDDRPMIMQFIDAKWKKNHILSRDTKLFNYEFQDGNQLNFVLAIDRNSKTLEGLAGFLPCSLKAKMRYDVWGSFWKVNDSHDNMALLGVELAKRVYSLTGCRMHIGNGANPKTTIPLRRLFFGDHVGKMNQHYLLNPDIDDFHIASIDYRPIQKTNQSMQGSELIPIYSANALKEIFDIESLDTFPYKDMWYINKRYFTHPYYHYDVFAIASSGEIKAILFGREVQYGNSKIWRIVDYIGDHFVFGGLYKELIGLMRKNTWEYIDFYSLGFDSTSIENAGFSKRQDDDTNILPNYFSPFLQENIDIWVHYRYPQTTFFKADGDQDRPN